MRENSTVRPLLIYILIFFYRIIPLAYSSDVTKYEWEGFDNYQILGFSYSSDSNKKNKRKNKNNNGSKVAESRRKERNEITNAQIRKAYRKQAQLHHPDKVLEKQKQNNTSSNNNSDHAFENDTIIKNQEKLMEEANERFSRISQAYDILSNEESRREYDVELYQDEIQRFSYSSSNLNNQDDNNEYSAPNFDTSYFHGQNQPDNVYERTERRWDYHHQVEVITVIRTEEYLRSGYFIVLGQEFIYRPSANQYQRNYYNYYQQPEDDGQYIPVSDVFVIDEGPMNYNQHMHRNRRDYNNNNKWSYKEEREPKMIHLTKTLFKSIKDTCMRVDSFWSEILQEAKLDRGQYNTFRNRFGFVEHDDYDYGDYDILDHLDTFGRVITKASIHIGRNGLRMIQEGIKQHSDTQYSSYYQSDYHDDTPFEERTKKFVSSFLEKAKQGVLEGKMIGKVLRDSVLDQARRRRWLRTMFLHKS